MESVMPTPSPLPEGDPDRDLVLGLMRRAIAHARFWMKKLGWSPESCADYWQALARQEQKGG